MDTGFEVRLLGPMEVSSAGRIISIGAPKHRILLAALALDAGRAVPADQLVAHLWGSAASPTARATLYSYVARLRRTLADATGADLVSTCADGYRIGIAEQAVDVFRFDDLARRAVAAERDPVEAASLLSAGLALWRGDVLADVPSDLLRAKYAPALVERRLTAIELRVDADLRLGRHRDVIGELRELTVAHPLRERFWAQRMLALYRAGRQAEALDCYRDVRRTLADELGVDPGEELLATHHAVLTSDAALSLPAADVPKPAPRRNDLPGDIPDFTGREEEVGLLLDVLPGDGHAATVVISAIDGMAGVGKTTLAISAAHRLADRYPDAQLFIDLRAHSAEGQPVPPNTALDTLLRALGVPAERIPSRLAERASLWRAELASRRALVVLDNAACAAQVRPLLPGGAGCLVLVTSRNRLADLDTASSISLDVLAEADALALFAKIVGRRRCADELDAAREVVRLCGHLPLAIRIAGARLRSRPKWLVADLADLLRDERRRLAELVIGERSVAAALTLSYGQLPAAHRRLFRLLGLVPGPTFDAYAAAALTGGDVATVARELEDLVDAHVLGEHEAGRYRFHDLLAQHARARCASEETPAAKREALGRLLDYYVYVARAAADHVDPDSDIAATVRLHAPGGVPPIPDRESAFAWYLKEDANLLAATFRAADLGLAEPALRLPFLLWRFAYVCGRLREWLPAQERGWAMARETADGAIRAAALRILGVSCQGLARFREALDYGQQALAASRQLGDRAAQGRVLNNLGNTHQLSGRYREARQCYVEGLALLDEVGGAGHRGVLLGNLTTLCELLGLVSDAVAHGQQALDSLAAGQEQVRAAVLTTFSMIRLRAGRYPEALELGVRAYAIRRQSGHRVGMVDALIKLTTIHTQLGDHPTALRLGEQALELACEIGDANNAAEVHNTLGETKRSAGRHDEARGHHERALTLARDIGNAYEEARAHEGLAETVGTADPDVRDRYRQQALAIYETLGVPAAARSRESAPVGPDVLRDVRV